MSNIDYIGANELVFNTDAENGVYSGGFNVDSIMMKYGMTPGASPIMTLNTQGGANSNKVSDLFNSLVIPNWALSYDNKMFGGNNNKMKNNDDSDDSSDEEIDDDLHDKLLGLVKEHDNKISKMKKKTRRVSKNKRATTKKRNKKQ